MSTKDNVDFVKEELNSEEKFLEGTVKVERFFNKYKKLIISLGSILVIAIIAFFVNENMQETKKINANIAYDKVIKDPTDKEALATLKDSNKKLYEIAQYQIAKKDGKDVEITVPYLKELAAYEKALKNKSIPELNSLSMENDFLLKEFAIFNKALILTNEGKYKEAKTALKLIPKDSRAYELTKLLEHHLLTK